MLMIVFSLIQITQRKHVKTLMCKRLKINNKKPANALGYNTIQYNTITLFKEGSAITYYSFLTYGLRSWRVNFENKKVT